ncbi:hypothetical protein QBC45DRAFT_108191 [Copromyces sp. CBS 386.78]|nr:hypothetical protein QBC45DRAFT_108191 [Copromyces sp. CBS 386.78]
MIFLAPQSQRRDLRPDNPSKLDEFPDDSLSRRFTDTLMRIIYQDDSHDQSSPNNKITPLFALLAAIASNNNLADTATLIQLKGEKNLSDWELAL